MRLKLILYYNATFFSRSLRGDMTLTYATVAISTLRTGEKTPFDTFPEGNKKSLKSFGWRIEEG